MPPVLLLASGTIALNKSSVRLFYSTLIAGCALSFVIASAIVTSAHAHGPAPAALEAQGLDGDAPEVVRTNIGLSVRTVDGYRYICPSQWGSEEVVPDVVRFSEGQILTVYRGVAYVSDSNGCEFTATPLEGWAGTLPEIVLGPSAAWAVARGQTSQLWRIEANGAGHRVIEISAVIDSVLVARNGDVWMGAAQPSPTLYIWRSDELEKVELTMPIPPQYLTLRGEPSRRLFVITPDADGVVAYEWDGQALEPRLRGLIAIHGPVEGEHWIASVDGTRYDSIEGEFIAGDEVRWTCLQSLGTSVLACENRGLTQLEKGERVFELQGLLGPMAGCPADEETRQICDQQWLHFGAEAGLVSFDAGILEDVGVDTGPPSAERLGGCHTAPGSSLWVWGVLLLGLRRRRDELKI